MPHATITSNEDIFLTSSPTTQISELYEDPDPRTVSYRTFEDAIRMVESNSSSNASDNNSLLTIVGYILPEENVVLEMVDDLTIGNIGMKFMWRPKIHPVNVQFTCKLTGHVVSSPSSSDQSSTDNRVTPQLKSLKLPPTMAKTEEPLILKDDYIFVVCGVEFITYSDRRRTQISTSSAE
ncbi:hypothetical protein BKA69DRAFT_1170316 [Paraphysoderma sedebokerense]|nr:hypothetical protein BKA69DRAFT_1170316 [Paraphysoderma sedebokerense]